MKNLEIIAWNNFKNTINDAYEKVVDSYEISDYVKESQQEKLNFLYSENVNVFNFDKVGLPTGRSYDFLISILKKNHLTKISKHEFSEQILNNAKTIYLKHYKEHFEQLALIEEQLKEKSLTKEITKMYYKKRKCLLQKIYPPFGIVEEEKNK